VRYVRLNVSISNGQIHGVGYGDGDGDGVGGYPGTSSLMVSLMWSAGTLPQHSTSPGVVSTNISTLPVRAFRVTPGMVRAVASGISLAP